METRETRLTDSTYEEFVQCAQKKKVVLFGAGNHVPVALRELRQSCIEPAYIIDNAFWRWSQYADGCEISSLQRLENENMEETVVLITAPPIFEMEKQLARWNVRHCYSFLLFWDKLHALNDRLYVLIDYRVS